MNTIRNTTERTPCGRSLQELEIPMVNSMVSCLGSEHKKLDEQTLPLALAATRLARDKDPIAGQAALEAWEQVQGYLFSHLQIEDALVLTWGLDHGAISTTLLDSLSLERQEMRGLMEGMPAPSGQDRQPKTTRERQALAQRLLALVRLLDQHIARYDSEVLPSIRRALFK